MLKGLLNTFGARGKENEPSIQILQQEREKFEEALRNASRTPKEVGILINGEKYVVFADGYGKRARKIK